ncbi:efflux RND transporter periplasmic adaptor subunit [Blautia sp. XA-2221]|uniref:efflux RND transporter periplasmic adaptor subunit n=1 Tax=Blautia sp. XA-2221 TaxID=2903961 RepID=UPI0023780599|nr:efflux RND transporter periplasmic adaptor subunit [Blautia sp. XA-2221]
MKKRILILLGILIISGAAGGVCWKMGVFGQEQESGETAYVTEISQITGDVAGIANRYAGVVEPQKTEEVELENGRKVKTVKVKTGEEVKQGQLLFEYDLTSIQEDLEETQLDLDRLKNEAASLNEQIATLEKEKKQAEKKDQLSYTIEIETNKMNLKKNEYSQKSKQAEIAKLQNTMGNTEVRSPIDGVIQKIDTTKLTTGDDGTDGMDQDLSYSDTSMAGDSSQKGFITILSTGAYRIKGTVNEMNVGSIIEGQPVIIRSRVDEKQVWKGTMGSVDRESANSQNSNNSWGMIDASGDAQTSSTTYPFYVELQSSEGLMLGQHVYIEPDEGQEEKKEGLWLSEFYIVDADTNSPYVWAADKDKRLVKKSVILGQYDENLGEYEIVEGLTKKDCIAYPSELYEEGMKTTTNSAAATDFTTLEMENAGNGDKGMQPPEAPVEEIPSDDGTAEIPDAAPDEISEEEPSEEGSVSSSDMGSSMEDSMMEMTPDAALPENEVLVPAGNE